MHFRYKLTIYFMTELCYFVIIYFQNMNISDQKTKTFFNQVINFIFMYGMEIDTVAINLIIIIMI